jgi:methionyl-tRNA formyltransferase
VDDERGWDDLEPKFGPVLGEIFPSMLDRVERGDPGDPQSEDGATYYSFFEPEYAWIDWARPAAEIARQVRAWRFHSPAAPHGALTELDGETVRVLGVSLEPADGREMRCGDGTLWIVETEAA